MRSRNFIIIIMVLVFILNTGVLMCYSQESSDKDNFGKVIGRVVDVETKEPVKEQFDIYFFSGSTDFYLQEISEPVATTDSNGYFSTKSKLGRFYLFCKPKNKESEYTDAPSPLDYPHTLQSVTVEKGKISRIMKNVHYGGKLKIVLITPSGSKFVPSSIIPNAKVEPSLRNVTINTTVERCYSIGNLTEGEITFSGIYPDIHYLEIDFWGMGYGSRRIEDILIEGRSTTEIKVVVDMDDNTGVEGIIYAPNGKPLAGAKVIARNAVYEKRKYFPRATAYTNSEGYYKITGLVERLYNVRFIKYVNGEKDTTYYTENIKILKNNVLKLNKVLN